ncbi:ABC transporter substrate-binding protein [Timonella sp. A28]|uniref:ABC transporter substrate-binding protein n=1 Tax=Timonella sp. A28 TaxID=3442640 RepID=UPI003EBAB126
MKFRVKGAVGLIAASTLLLAACSGGDDNSGSDSNEPFTMTFQSLSDQPGAIAATEEIVAAWNTANPDRQVEIVPAGWDGVYDKLVTQFNGDAAPDIIHYETASIIPFAADGYIADLSEHITDEVKNDVDQGVWDSVTVDGKIIAVPTEMQSYMAFANKKILEDAGVEIPTGDTMTWDQLRDIAKKTTNSDHYGLAWGLKNPTAAFMSLGLGFDGTYFSGTGDDVTFKVDAGELEVPKRVGEMAFDDKSIDPISLTQSGSEVLATFYGGKAAMTVQGSYQAANMVKDAPADIDWIVLPPLEGTVSANQAANPQTLSVNIDSAHVDAAAEFIMFFTSGENVAKLNKADALIPASKSARDIIATETQGKDGWDMTLKSGQNLTSAPFLFVNKYTQWKETVATPNFQKFLAQEIDLNQLGAELNTGWEQVSR